MGSYAAAKDHTVHSHQLQRATADRIRNRRVNERTGREIPSEKIVKGYEVAEGECIVVEPTNWTRSRRSAGEPDRGR
ncbi:Ku protein [Streptomyces sp. NPDC005374]|uniref:Ku protein n=1 Tax=Streptomyces sp. NPDC005374 TaxID=3364713 RepID=UPI0036B0C5D5